MDEGRRAKRGTPHRYDRSEWQQPVAFAFAGSSEREAISVKGGGDFVRGVDEGAGSSALDGDVLGVGPVVGGGSDERDKGDVDRGLEDGEDAELWRGVEVDDGRRG